METIEKVNRFAAPLAMRAETSPRVIHSAAGHRGKVRDCVEFAKTQFIGAPLSLGTAAGLLG